MEETTIQKVIRERVTHSLDYVPRITERDLQRYESRIKYGIETFDTELDLQMHLGTMELRTAEDYFARRILLDNIFALAEIKEELRGYSLTSRLETPIQVVYSLSRWYQKKRARDPRVPEPKEAEFFVASR